MADEITGPQSGTDDGTVRIKSRPIPSNMPSDGHDRSKALLARVKKQERQRQIEQLQAGHVEAARRRDADGVKLTAGMLRQRRRQDTREAGLRRRYVADTLRLLRPRSTPRERRPVGCSRPRSRRTRTARATRAGPDSSGDSDPGGDRHPLAVGDTAGGGP